jgi:hypothetical protein
MGLLQPFNDLICYAQSRRAGSLELTRLKGIHHKLLDRRKHVRGHSNASSQNGSDAQEKSPPPSLAWARL